MVIRLIARLPRRQQGVLVSSLTPEGILTLTNLLLGELSLMDDFELGYATPELRKLEVKQIRKGVTPNEEKQLREAKKVFTGRLKRGEYIKSEKAITLVNNIISLFSKSEYLITMLASATKGGSYADVMVLGERLSVLNISQKKLSELVFMNVFTQPEWVFDEINRLIELKAVSDIKKAFTTSHELNSLFARLGCFSEEDEKEVVSSLMGIGISSERNANEIVELIKSGFTAAAQLDREFDLDVYNEVHPFLPQYHCVNSKWFAWFCSSFIGEYKPYVSPNISEEILLGYYRKAVEVLANS